MLPTGVKAPEFRLKGLDGKPYSLDPEQRQLTLAIFFKTTCPTCQYAWPYYERLHQAYHGAGLRLWGISQHDAERTARYAQKYGATFPHLIDEGLRVSLDYDPDFVPTGFLIDRNGKISHRFESWYRDALNHFSHQLAKQLGAPAQIIVKPEDNALAFKAG